MGERQLLIMQGCKSLHNKARARGIGENLKVQVNTARPTIKINSPDTKIIG